MKNSVVLAALLIALAGGALLPAQTARSGDVQFKAAQHKEEVEGDLKGAIALYQAVTAGTDRALAARALVRIGACHEKLGAAEAANVYERVVRDFSDQAQAAGEARSRLAALRPRSPAGSGMLSKQVWSGPDIDNSGTVSDDGRLLSFTDWTTGDLAIRDLMLGTNRRLTNKGTVAEAYIAAEQSVTSPDGKQVAYSWSTLERGYELRVVDSTEGATPRVLFANQDVDWLAPYDWSDDGQWIAIIVTRKDRTVQVGLVSRANGTLRVLKSIEWRASTKLAFSPDSRYLAFDLPFDDKTEQRDIYALAIDGSRETPLVTHSADDRVVGWTPDGRHLLFASNRTGTMDLWAVPIKDARAQGAPVFVKSAIGQILPMGVTRSGALYYSPASSGVSVDLAVYNEEKATLEPAPRQLQLMGSHQPDWSPDGKQLAVASNRGNRFNIITIQSMETGRVRELVPGLNYLQFPSWSPDGGSLVMQGTDRKGRQGVFRIDADSGALSEVTMRGQRPMWTPDGTRIVFSRFDEERNEGVILERVLKSGVEREVLRRKNVVGVSLALSSDGKFVAFKVLDPGAREGSLHIASVETGETRELLRVQAPMQLGNFVDWTPNGRSLMVVRWPAGLTDGQADLIVVPVDGGPSRVVTTSLQGIRGVRFQPGGKVVAFFAQNDLSNDIWVVDNFLGMLASKR